MSAFTVTLQQFLERCPEFKRLECEGDSAGYVQRVLTAQLDGINLTLRNDAQNLEFVCMLTAQALARSPAGVMAGFSDAAGKTVYDIPVADFKRVPGFGVI